MRVIMLFAAAAFAAGAAVGSAASAETADAGAPPAPLTDADFRSWPNAQVRLGRMLFFDRALSGNGDVSCATCHHPSLAGGDGLSLGVGAGGYGLGPERSVGDAVLHRVPRNAPGLFNLGALEVSALFWDGRLEVDASEPSGFRAPQRFDLPAGLRSVTAAQALFPVVSEIEMAGAPEDNEIALAAWRAPHLGWDALIERLVAIEGYPPLFAAAYPDLSAPATIDPTHYANALAAFIETEFRADDSPFDRHLRGDADAMSADARAGMALFYGAAGCASCHSGPLLTDQRFHAIAMPQIGPGRTPLLGRTFSDVGRLETTGDLADAYRFRTPSLRNVAATAPYGHAGAYATLEEVVRHHLDPEAAFASYGIQTATLPPAERLGARDGVAMADPIERSAILAANELTPTALSAADVAALVAFLEALTDEASLDGRLGRPDSVPSGLPID